MALISPITMIQQPPGRKPPFGTPLNRSHPLAQGLVGCYLLNESGGDKAYDNVDQISGTLQAGALWVGGGLNVYPQDACVNCGTTKHRFTTENFTICVDVMIPATVANYDTIISKGVMGAGGAGYLLQIESAVNKNYVFQGYDTTTRTTKSNNGVFAFNKRSHLVIVKQTGTAPTIYVDGLNQTSGTVANVGAITWSSEYNYYIGRHNAANYDFTGTIYSNYLYNRALSQNDVQSLYIDPYQMFRPSMPYWFWSSLGGVTTSAPTTIAPTTILSTTLAPTTLAPTTLEPTTLAPTTIEPTTLPPTTLEPTTLPPTTLEPTTLAPTTLEPTTVMPTTLAPTTLAPTTLEPTTVAPTTLAPTTIPPTTLAPTTLEPTTLPPTTILPTTLAPTTTLTTPAPTTLPPTTLPPTTLTPTTFLTTLTPTTIPPGSGEYTLTPIFAVLKRNKSDQHVAVYAWDTVNLKPVVGDAANIFARIAIDDGIAVPITDVNPIEVHPIRMPGIYRFNLTQAETNGDLIIIRPYSITTNVVLNPIFANTLLSAFAWVRTA